MVLLVVLAAVQVVIIPFLLPQGEVELLIKAILAEMVLSRVALLMHQTLLVLVVVGQVLLEKTLALMALFLAATAEMVLRGVLIQLLVAVAVAVVLLAPLLMEMAQEVLVVAVMAL